MALKHTGVLYLYLLLFTCLCSYSARDIKPAGFIENKGQIVDQLYRANSDVLFLYSGDGIKIQLRRSGYSYELFRVNAPGAGPAGICMAESMGRPQHAAVQNYRVDIDFLGMKAEPEVVKEQQSPDYLNYYLHDKEATRVLAYQKITYKNIFKNIDIEFLLNGGGNNGFKYNLVLHPGADLDDVKFLVKGAGKISLSDNAIIISTPLGDITEKIPFSYYTDAPVLNHAIDFRLINETISFSGIYDTARTLVIDPSSNLIWSSYYGGGALDNCTSAGVDAQNNLYIAGHTMSTNNIATAGSYQSVLNASLDTYLAKFGPAGVRQWATYMGGSGVEQVFSMYVAPNGIVYTTGDTNSPSSVASSNAQQLVYGGGIDDALLSKFDPGGFRLWSTYFGGAEHDISQAVTVDGAGNVIISGHTESTVGIATPGAYSTGYVFGMDVFIAKFTGNGALLWATYYGDSGVDEAFAVGCDISNNIYVGGSTASLAGISTAGAHQPNNGGVQDAFLAKFNPAGTALAWSTYYGGGGMDKCTALKVNAAGNVVIGGNTTSSNGIASLGAYQVALGSADDAFLATFNSSGTRLWGSYFGGNNVDYINGMVLDASSNIVFCGQTMSTNSISTTGAYQPTLNTILNYDAFFAKFSAGGNKKLASYFGGPQNDNAQAIAQDNTGKIYIAGETTSTTGIASPGCHQLNPGNNGDGFLAKFCITFDPVLNPSADTTVCINSTCTVSALSGYSTYVWNNGFTVNPFVVTYTQQGTHYYSVFINDGFGCTSESDSLKITVADCYISLQENDRDRELLLYPVPSNDFIHFEWNNPAELTLVEIYAVTGQLLLANRTGERCWKADIRQLPPGIYLARVKNANGILEKKFIKE